MIRYLSLCSGIEAFSCAVRDMPDFVPVAFSEIEPFPCKVLEHHYPNVPNLGDMTKIDGRKFRGTVDLVVGGTPCQDFSVAGTRKGLAGERSGLALQYVKLVQAINPKWVLWENVPGVFSTNGGRDFQRFIFELAKCGLSLSWRILDARFFGVPQRRRRVFLVGHSGEWANSYKVLFERQSLCGNPKKSKKTGKEIAKCLTRGIGTRLDSETDTFVCGTLNASGAGTSRPAGQGNELDFCVPVTMRMREDCAGGGKGPLVSEDTSLTLGCHNDQIVLGVDTYNGTVTGDVAATLSAESNGSSTRNGPRLVEKMGVRRLTPIECERLQGFPDNYTNIPSASDTARYKALGNSMCVNVMRWIAERMAKVDKQ